MTARFVAKITLLCEYVYTIAPRHTLCGSTEG
jgi:hypothetical protein